jgi:hypothetical protein
MNRAKGYCKYLLCHFFLHTNIQKNHLNSSTNIKYFNFKITTHKNTLQKHTQLIENQYINYHLLLQVTLLRKTLFKYMKITYFCAIINKVRKYGFRFK